MLLKRIIERRKYFDYHIHLATDAFNLPHHSRSTSLPLSTIGSRITGAPGRRGIRRMRETRARIADAFSRCRLGRVIGQLLCLRLLRPRREFVLVGACTLSHRGVVLSSRLGLFNRRWETSYHWVILCTHDLSITISESSSQGVGVQLFGLCCGLCEAFWHWWPLHSGCTQFSFPILGTCPLCHVEALRWAARVVAVLVQGSLVPLMGKDL